MERTIFLVVENCCLCLNTFKTLRKNRCNIDLTLSQEFLTSSSRSWYWTKNSTYQFYKININQIYDAYVTQHKKKQILKKRWANWFLRDFLPLQRLMRLIFCAAGKFFGKKSTTSTRWTLHSSTLQWLKKTKYTRLKFTWMAAGFLVHVMAWLVEPLIICRPLPTLLFNLEVRLKKVSKIRTTL